MGTNLCREAGGEVGGAALAAMASYRAPFCISIYLPVEREPWGDEVNFARLRDALRAAARLLRERAQAPGVVDDVLGVAVELHDAAPLWSEPGPGLALFVAADRLLAYRLPVRPRPQVLLDDRFHLEPFHDALRTAEAWC